MLSYGPGPLDAPARAPVAPFLTLVDIASLKSPIPPTPTETAIFSKERGDAPSFARQVSGPSTFLLRFNLLTLVRAARSESSIPPTLTEISTSSTEPVPVFCAQVSHADCASGDSDVTSDEDTKESPDFTGEIRMLNESGAPDRRSFVEQLENAFGTPARVDLRYSFPEHAVDIPPVPSLPVGVQDPPAATTDLSTTTDDFSTDDTGVSESRNAIYSDGEEHRRRLSLPAESPSVDVVRERPGNPLASSRNSRPSDGQLNRSFKFGGSPMPSQRSDHSYCDGVSKVPFTLSDITSSHSQQLHNDSGGSLVEEDSSVLKSIMAQANTVLPVASEVAVPRARPRVGSNASIQDIVENFSRNSATSQVSDAPQVRTSFAGFDSFDEVRRGFEFGPNRPVFYPPVSLSRNHNKHDSMFSVASVSSFGSVIDNDAPDPFGYARHSRPPSEDMSISTSMTPSPSCTRNVAAV